MGIKSKINQFELQKWLKNSVENELHKRVLRHLNYLGMECIRIAKSLNTYKHRTGNLRNSIGYVILKNGTIVDSVFDTEAVGSESGEEGKSKGLKHAQDVAQNYANGYALIVVAGMEYAGYVEDVHNLPVLAPAENYAKAKAEQIMKNIIAKFE